MLCSQLGTPDQHESRLQSSEQVFRDNETEPSQTTADEIHATLPQRQRGVCVLRGVVSDPRLDEPQPVAILAWAVITDLLRRHFFLHLVQNFACLFCRRDALAPPLGAKLQQ